MRRIAYSAILFLFSWLIEVRPGFISQVLALELKSESETHSVSFSENELRKWAVMGDAVPRERAISVYKVSLDEPPVMRWNKLGHDYRHLSAQMEKVISEMVPKPVLPLVQMACADLDKYLPQPYADELRGMAKSLNTSLGNVVLLNLLYDLTAHCTSIVSEDDKGQIWHSRNLDYRFTPFLRNITIHVDFMKNGEVAYSGTSFAGYIGLITGQRPKEFTISVDERYEHTSVWDNALTALLDKKAGMISLTVRQVLAEASSFTEAVVRLAERDTIAPVYYIIGGIYPGQGAIITRDRLEAVDTWFLDPAKGRWFLVETNYDHWLPPPKSDDRRDAAIKMMKAAGQHNIDPAHLFKVMVTPPVGRPNYTVYTNVMSAGQPDVYSEWLWPINTTNMFHASKLQKHDWTAVKLPNQDSHIPEQL